MNFGWNGFGFEGCVALSDALKRNTALEKLDLTCNRIHPPGLLELMKGLLINKVLKVLIVSYPYRIIGYHVPYPQTCIVVDKNTHCDKAVLREI